MVSISRGVLWREVVSGAWDKSFEGLIRLTDLKCHALVGNVEMHNHTLVVVHLNNRVDTSFFSVDVVARLEEYESMFFPSRRIGVPIVKRALNTTDSPVTNDLASQFTRRTRVLPDVMYFEGP